MKIIPASFEICDPIDGITILRNIEAAGRVCYKSEDKITETSRFLSTKKSRYPLFVIAAYHMKSSATALPVTVRRARGIVIMQKTNSAMN